MLPRTPSLLSIAFAVGATFATSTGASAQDLGNLRERCLLALHGENAPPSRQHALQPREAPKAGIARFGPRGADPVPQHACPLCKQNLVQVPLWKGKPGIDSRDDYTAHVCEQHALFFVTNDGSMHSSQAGPFALPADAKAKPARPFLPYGATLADDKEPWPGSKWASADGALFEASGDEGACFEVKNSDRSLYREPKAVNNGMGLVAWDISGDAGLCAYARSCGPLVVGELGTQKQRARVAMHADNIAAIAIHPAGTHVAFTVVEGGKQEPSFRMLDVGTGNVREFARAPAAVPTLFAFVPNGNRVITATHDGIVCGWSLATSRVEWTTNVDHGSYSFRALAVSPDGKRVLVVSRGGLVANVLDVRSGAIDSAITVREPFQDERAGGGTAIAWSADSTKFAWMFGQGRLARGDLAAPGEVKLHFGAAELASEHSWARLRFVADGKAVQTRDGAGHQLRWPLGTFDAPW
ncbi:MAG: WD40 repeat domain-containing protein [Planctomycetes bacterium]|nr:WD40 repeat domain-containing protein [Planctomycetota bacterium]